MMEVGVEMHMGHLVSLGGWPLQWGGHYTTQALTYYRCWHQFERISRKCLKPRPILYLDVLRFESRWLHNMSMQNTNSINITCVVVTAIINDLGLEILYWSNCCSDLRKIIKVNNCRLRWQRVWGKHCSYLLH